jgi:hypothetical protein
MENSNDREFCGIRLKIIQNHTKSRLKFRKFQFISKPKTNLMKTQRSALLNTKTNKSKSKSFNIFQDLQAEIWTASSK